MENHVLFLVAKHFGRLQRGLILDVGHHVDRDHVVVLESKQSLLELVEVGAKHFLDKLLLRLIAALGFAITAADEMRRHAHLGIQRRTSSLEAANVITTTEFVELLLGNEHSVALDGIIGDLVFEPVNIVTLLGLRRQR